jgi:nitrogen-specific signal transduction histidine kinase
MSPEKNKTKRTSSPLQNNAPGIVNEAVKSDDEKVHPLDWSMGLTVFNGNKEIVFASDKAIKNLGAEKIGKDCMDAADLEGKMPGIDKAVGEALSGRSCGISVAGQKGERTSYLFLPVKGVSSDDHVLMMKDETVKKAIHENSLKTLLNEISHQFNDFLTVIVGNMNIARTFLSENHDACISALQKAESSAMKMAALIDDLQLFASMKKLDSKVVKSRHIIDSAVEMVRICGDARVGIVYEKDQSDPYVIADKIRIEQALINIYRNSVEALKGKIDKLDDKNREDPEITISFKLVEKCSAKNCSNCDPDINHVQIQIADNGEGMDSHIRAHATDPLFSTKCGLKGRGLGLSLAKSIVNSQGGELLIQSERQKGTSVTICLPEISKG